jgi:hypothetical protein
MTDTATEKDHTATTQRKPRYMSSLEREQLLREMAVGTPLWVLASRYGKSYDHIRQISSQCKEEITEIKRQLGEEMNILWAQDMTYRAMELQHSIEKTRQQQRRLEQEATEFSDSTGLGSGVVSEHWHKLDAHAAKLIHMLGEMLGQLPTRRPPEAAEGSRMTYEVKGVDVGEVVKEWTQAQ